MSPKLNAKLAISKYFRDFLAVEYWICSWESYCFLENSVNSRTAWTWAMSWWHVIGFFSILMRLSENNSTTSQNMCLPSNISKYVTAPQHLQICDSHTTSPNMWQPHNNSKYVTATQHLQICDSPTTSPNMWQPHDISKYVSPTKSPKIWQPHNISKYVIAPQHLQICDSHTTSPNMWQPHNIFKYVTVP